MTIKNMHSDKSKSIPEYSNVKVCRNLLAKKLQKSVFSASKFIDE